VWSDAEICVQLAEIPQADGGQQRYTKSMNERESVGAVTLISFTDDIYCIGPRRISAQLKRNGFAVNLLFLRPTDLSGQLRQRFRSDYYNDDLPDSLYDQLIPICKNSSVIGISVWTHQAEQVGAVTERLRKEVGSLVVWGGIHPTSYPKTRFSMPTRFAWVKGTSAFSV
jgi:hypothetical protein